MAISVEELERDQLRLPSLSQGIFGLLLGILFISFSFPNGVTKLGDALGWSFVQALGLTAKSVLISLFGASPDVKGMTFTSLWSGVLIALVVYLGALTLLSFRHQRFDLVVSGFSFLILGTALLYLVAWVLYIVLIIFGWIFQILGLLFGLIGSLFAFLFKGVVWLFGNVVSGGIWWVFALLFLALIIFLAVKYRNGFFIAVLQILGLCGGVALVAGVLYLLGKLFQILSPFFAFIGQILGVLLHFLLYVLIGLFVVLGIYWFGSLLIGQFRGAWKAGNGRRGIMIGALSIGTSLAFILLESNLYGLTRFFPASLPLFIATNLHIAAPVLGTTITLCVIIVAIIGVLRNLPKLQKEPALREFQIVLATVAPLALVSVLVLLAHGHTGDN